METSRWIMANFFQGHSVVFECHASELLDQGMLTCSSRHTQSSQRSNWCMCTPGTPTMRRTRTYTRRNSRVARPSWPLSLILSSFKGSKKKESKYKLQALVSAGNQKVLEIFWRTQSSQEGQAPSFQSIKIRVVCAILTRVKKIRPKVFFLSPRQWITHVTSITVDGYGRTYFGYCG